MDVIGSDEVAATLTSDVMIVPPAPAHDGPVGLAWLRAHVVRFSEGPERERRRQIVERVLATADPVRVRETARRYAEGILADAESTVDLMADVARVVPVRALADALGVAAADPADVAAVAPRYLTGAEPGEATDAADAAVIRLATAVDEAAGTAGTGSEETAAVVGVLVQAYEATAGLIGNACLTLWEAAPDRDSADVVVDDTVRGNPPVLATRRMSAVESPGAIVRVDLVSAGLPFGAGRHACPGVNQARAIALGVVDAVRGWRAVEPEVMYLGAPNLRMPARVLISRSPLPENGSDGLA